MVTELKPEVVINPIPIGSKIGKVDIPYAFECDRRPKCVIAIRETQNSTDLPNPSAHLHIRNKAGTDPMIKRVFFDTQ